MQLLIEVRRFNHYVTQIPNNRKAICKFIRDNIVPPTDKATEKSQFPLETMDFELLKTANELGYTFTEVITKNK